VDWSLRGCARHGHITYAPTEPELAERLHAQTLVGEAWRCLRCESFVVGEPHGAGPADDAPTVLRGRQLREATILRFFAVERWARAFVLALLGYAVLRFRTSEQSLQETFDRVLPAAQPLAKALDLNINNSPTIERIHKLLETRCSPTPASRSPRASASGRSSGGASTSRWWPRRCSSPSRCTSCSSGSPCFGWVHSP
jgi:hypothetical protein